MSADPRKVRFGVVFTYRCNNRCRWCNRFLDQLSWPDSDITEADLVEGWERVQQSGVKVAKARVTGGEPLLHPQFTALVKIVRDNWNADYGGRTPVFTNGSLPLPQADGWRYRIGTVGEGYQPPMVSPLDLGLVPRYGIFEPCARQRGCGRLFDAFGFSFCVFAGAIGRLLRIDPYHPYPVSMGVPEICGHCPFSVGIRKAFHLFELVKQGRVEYPTLSYWMALRRLEKEGPMELVKFRNRS